MNRRSLPNARVVESLMPRPYSDPAIEDAWAAEVERRDSEIEKGAVALVPGPDALAELRAEFQ
jgi:hypothetical protein